MSGQSNVTLTCDETPLAWPGTVAVGDLTVCSTCAIDIFAPQAGSLQILTRRQGSGVGDGVNIEEDASVGADFRGQRYVIDEAIFHTPGLHVFPGQTAVYPAEYHVHMSTFSSPKRSITIVLPVSHLVTTGPGSDYFAAAAAQPDPGATRPTLNTLFTPGTQVIQYLGPDLRGRTADQPQCDAPPGDRTFLLVLQVAQIRAMDLERIPREGSLSTDPRDLPAPGVTPAATVLRDRLLRTAILAQPGIRGATATTDPAPPPPSSTPLEMECRPITVVDGRDVIQENGKTTDIYTLLGISSEVVPASGTPSATGGLPAGVYAASVVATLIGFTIADYLVKYLWTAFFDGPGARVSGHLVMKWVVFVALSLSGPSILQSLFNN